MDVSELQVADDPALLDRMMSQLSRADDLYQPTNYWAYYQRHFVPELKRHGLHDFRRRRGSVLSSFGATDLLPQGLIEVSPGIPAAGRIASILNRLVWLTPGLSLRMWGINGTSLTRYFYARVREKFERLGLPLGACGTSRHGNPEDLVEVEGALWSYMHLQYCSMLADALGHIELPDDAVVCELGSGLGRNIEVMARLFPRATLLLFDIPPQLYVANQYLRTVFGDRVVNYDEAVGVTPQGQLPESVRGRIVVLPTWRFPAWSGVAIDLFWNSASFQEMEPHIVRNYLGGVSRMQPRWVYINALPTGNYWGSGTADRGGTKAPVLDRYYAEGLGGDYQLQMTYPTEYFLREQDYTSYIYRRIVT
jgi:putative sugar O-methyltransferase